MADLIGDQLEELKKALAENTKQQQELQDVRSKESSSGKKGVMTKEIMELVSKSAGLTSEIGALQGKLTTLTGLPKLTEQMAAETKELNRSNEAAAVGKRLEELNSLMSSTSNSQELNNLFKETLAKLEDPSLSDEEKNLLHEQIDAINDGAQSEENRREAAKLAAENNSRLFQMAEGIEGMGNKFDKFTDNFKKGAGLIGALGAIGLLLFSPETLYKIIDSVINFFDDMYKTIQAIVGGDWGTAKDLVMDNLKGIGIAVAGFFAIFGGTIMRGIGSVLKMARTFGNIVGKIGKVFGKIFIPFTIAMGAFAAITGFIEGFKEGGILEGLKQGIISLFDTLVAAPLDLLKDGVAWVLGKFGFENAAEILESFSFSDIFSNMFGALFNVIGQAVDWVKSLFTFSEPEEGSFSLSNLIFSALDKVKNLFVSLFDFLPSFSDIKDSIVNMMPSWMRGFISEDDSEETSVSDVANRGRARLEEARRDRNMITGSDELSVSRIGAEPQSPQIEAQPTTTPGAVLASSNRMMDNKAEAASQTNMTIIQATGGGGRSAPSNNSATANTYNISQGISMDDFMRIDFANRLYPS